MTARRLPKTFLRPTALIAAKPPEGRFSTSPQLLKLWNKTVASVKIERCVRLGSEQRAGFIIGTASLFGTSVASLYFTCQARKSPSSSVDNAD